MSKNVILLLAVLRASSALETSEKNAILEFVGMHCGWNLYFGLALRRVTSTRRNPPLLILSDRPCPYPTEGAKIMEGGVIDRTVNVRLMSACRLPLPDFVCRLP